MDLNHYRETAKQLRNELERTQPSHRVTDWLAGYLKAAKALPESLPYHYQGPELQSIDQQITLESGTAYLEVFHKLALVLLIIDAVEALADDNLSADVCRAFKESIVEIVKDIDVNPYGNGQFLATQEPWTRYWTYLGIASVKIHPVGIRILIPQRISVDHELCDLVSVPDSNDGHVWMYQTHLYPVRIYRPGFLNQTAFEESLKLTAQLLETNPRFIGVYCSNWFHDPQLGLVSPHLAYIKDVVQQAGAVLRKCETTAQVIRQATQASSTRRKLYEAGKYTPACYQAIHPRDDLIRWAQRQR